MLNPMVQSDLVTYKGGTIVILFLQATIVLTGNSKSANSDDEVRFSDFGGVMIPFY